MTRRRDRPTGTATRPAPDPRLARHRPFLDELAARWDIPGLPDRILIEPSPRMRQSLGRCYPERPLVRVAGWLLERGDAARELIREVLAHELAHVVVHERHGRTARPHGRAWRDLMHAAGFTPRVRLALPAELAPPQRRRRPTARPLYLHRCPRCGAHRLAGRPVRAWRCVACTDHGHTGALEIYRLPPGTHSIRHG